MYSNLQEYKLNNKEQKGFKEKLRNEKQETANLLLIFTSMSIMLISAIKTAKFGEGVMIPITFAALTIYALLLSVKFFCLSPNSFFYTRGEIVCKWSEYIKDSSIAHFYETIELQNGYCIDAVRIRQDDYNALDTEVILAYKDGEIMYILPKDNEDLLAKELNYEQMMIFKKEITKSEKEQKNIVLFLDIFLLVFIILCGKQITKDSMLLLSMLPFVVTGIILTIDSFKAPTKIFKKCRVERGIVIDVHEEKGGHNGIFKEYFVDIKTERNNEYFGRAKDISKRGLEVGDKVIFLINEKNIAIYAINDD